MRETCAKNKSGAYPQKAPMQSIDVNKPFVFWAMYYMGPLPEIARGNKHLLVVMDHFRKWCEAFPTKDQKAHTVAQILVSTIFSRFGSPNVIQSDQGRNFESHLIQEVSLMSIHKSRTAAYHPQCDGLVEKQSRTLQDVLSAYVSDHQDDWGLWVSLAVYAYNASTHESTGFSPYELVFGRIALTPLELDLDLPLKNPCSQSEYIRSIREHLHSTKQVAQQNLAESRLKLNSCMIVSLELGYLTQLVLLSGCISLNPGNLGADGWAHIRSSPGMASTIPSAQKRGRKRWYITITSKNLLFLLATVLHFPLYGSPGILQFF